MSVSGDTVKYVGIIASILLPLIIFLIGYQVIRSYQFEKEIKETKKSMMDEYQKMLNIRTESENFINDTKSKMKNLQELVGDVTTRIVSTEVSEIVKKEVKKQTEPVFEVIKTKDEEINKNIELMKKIEKLDLTLTPSLYMERGKIYLGQGNNEKAIENFSEAIKLNSHSFEVYFSRGLAYHLIKKLDEAIEDYEKAIKINQKEYATYVNIGLCYREKKEHDYKKSIQYLTEAVKLNPKDDFVYLQRGITYQNDLEYDLAINDFKQIELNQESPYLKEALFNIGFCYGKKNRFNFAIEYYQKRFNKERDLSTALNLAEAYICNKSFSDAEKWANISYTLSDTNIEHSIIAKFLLTTALILNNKEYTLELNSLIDKIKTSLIFEVAWSFNELSECLTAQSIPTEKTKLINKLIALLKKEIQPEDFIIPS